MIRLGNYYIGVSNNWRKLHGIPMMHTKRFKHERHDLPKHIRIGYHARRKAGCDYDFLQKYLGKYAR